MSECIKMLRMFATLTKGSKQCKHYKNLIRDAREVKVVSYKDVLTKEQIEWVENVMKPKRGECYKNATLLAHKFNLEYVEGQSYNVIPIDHAFNRVGDKYIDVTYEFALKEDVTKNEYITFGIYDIGKVIDICLKTGVYGGIYEYYERENQH